MASGVKAYWHPRLRSSSHWQPEPGTVQAQLSFPVAQRAVYRRGTVQIIWLPLDVLSSRDIIQIGLDAGALDLFDPPLMTL